MWAGSVIVRACFRSALFASFQGVNVYVNGSRKKGLSLN